MLDEAIKELKKDTEHPTAHFMPDLLKAQQLGIEALELIERKRKTNSLLEWLPSETEEEK